MSTVVKRHASYDLHLHTHWSIDAEVSAESYLQRATELGMRCLAFTDHDNCDAGIDLTDLAPRYPDVRVVLGAEFNVGSEIGVHHILAYGLDGQPSSTLEAVLALYRERSHQEAQHLCRSLQAGGVKFSEDDLRTLLLSVRPGRVVEKQGLTPAYRTHLQAHFEKLGILEEGQALNDLRAPVPGKIMPLPSADQVIPALKDSGALVAAAHPTVFWRKQGRTVVEFSDQHMRSLHQAFDIEGVECAHMPADEQEACREYCKRNGLFSVAGTDKHRAEGDFMLGTHGGSEDWLPEFLDRLD
jgi:PHP domain